VLLTRSPLEYPRRGLSARLACVKHAASVRPEPGSNSPSRSYDNPRTHAHSAGTRDHRHKKRKSTPAKQHTPKGMLLYQRNPTTTRQPQTHKESEAIPPQDGNLQLASTIIGTLLSSQGSDALALAPLRAQARRTNHSNSPAQQVKSANPAETTSTRPGRSSSKYFYEPTPDNRPDPT
jgi:hypothetical protein